MSFDALIEQAAIISRQSAELTAQIAAMKAQFVPPPQPVDVEPGFVRGVSELAEYLGCCRSKAYKLIARPDFPQPRMVGERREWSKQDLRGWK